MAVKKNKSKSEVFIVYNKRARKYFADINSAPDTRAWQKYDYARTYQCKEHAQNSVNKWKRTYAKTISSKDIEIRAVSV